jgi:photosystem II stability/assembly factor-like uncharacterized protein
MKFFFALLLPLLFGRGAIFAQHNWNKLNSPPGTHKVVDFFSVDSGYLVVDSTLFLTTNGGITWLKRNAVPANTSFLHFLNADTGVANTGYSRRIFHTIDGGITWQQNLVGAVDSLDDELMTFNFHSGSPFGVISNICYKCDPGGAIPYTINAGIDWQLRRTDYFSKAWQYVFKSPKTGIGVFDNGFLMPFLGMTNDSGRHWITSDSGINKPHGDGYQVSLSYLNNGAWIVSFYDALFQSSFFYKSTNDGTSWDNISSVKDEVYSTTFFDSVGFTTESVYSTNDYGDTWIKENIPTSNRTFQFSVPSTEVAFCLTDSEIFKTDNKNSVSLYNPLQTITLLSNPVAEFADLNFKPREKPGSIEIFDAIGRRVATAQIPANSTSYRFDVRSFSAGVYSVRIGERVMRFVKTGP